MRWWNGVSWSDTYQRGSEQSRPGATYAVPPPAYGPNKAYPTQAMPAATAPGPALSFGAAIASVFRQYAGFTGVASRSEFWYFALFSLLVRLALAIPDAAISYEYDLDSGLLSGLWTLAVLLPSLAVGVRRLRDAGYSWAWIFMGLIPIVGTITLIVMLASRPAALRTAPTT